MSGRTKVRGDVTVRVDHSAGPPTDRPGKHSARPVWLVGTAVAVSLLVWSASRRVACGPAAGGALSGAVASPQAASVERLCLRLGTLNIHGGKGRDRVYDLDRTVACLQGLDLVGLNEVHGARFWQETDQAELLGRKLGLGWLFAPAEQRWWHYRFGNAVLTSMKVTHWQRVGLPRRYGKSFRNLLLLGVQCGGRPIYVIITHVDRSDDRERAAQLRTVGDLFLSLAEPAVLLGDLNTAADDPAIERLLAMPGVEDPVAKVLGDKTPRRIDWILTRGLRCVDAGIVDQGASDHPLMWAQLELPVSFSSRPGRIE